MSLGTSNWLVLGVPAAALVLSCAGGAGGGGDVAPSDPADSNGLNPAEPAESDDLDDANERDGASSEPDPTPVVGEEVPDSSPPLISGEAESDPTPEVIFETVGEIQTPGQPAAVPSNDACAETSASSGLSPAKLLIGLDRSTSMVIDDRWSAVTEALASFLGDAESAGLEASLQLFPPPEVDDPAIYCSEARYSVPDVANTVLPNAAPFIELLDTTGPSGWTPTRPLVSGFIAQANEAIASDPGAVVALVLVTDGTPSVPQMAADFCGTYGENTVASVAGIVASVADRIPTYVIGIGPELDRLNEIAEAGGTDSAVLVEATDPASARLEVFERFNGIRDEIQTCDIVIPPPPSGQTLDPLRVSTKITSGLTAPLDVPYTPDCSTGIGWNYDDLDAPSSISLCSQSCETLRQLDGSSLEVVFGCTVNPQIIR